MNNKQVSAAVEAISAIGRVIRDVKRIPSGHLYAQLMGVLSLEKYQIAIAILKKGNLIKEEANELIWIAD
jgi:hypothetical protein